ncbi:hypothetical protein PPERSA_02726 [Pseudocohnilembus persalinus]|uniref:Uncharacterized protein n=1 Tax=Pseudocohnilembus persalinus TaxID=266149 RepID=A0A0V0R5U4_PSEPJ|nr:hypothetical protein PPERSA_02726 [Pseudocohnilembus persalinus]|eukprot:KRX09854.1 hypothetical protein PPERSA_02726 [Pseudocohnilembus persalinus]
MDTGSFYRYEIVNERVGVDIVEDDRRKQRIKNYQNDQLQRVLQNNQHKRFNVDIRKLEKQRDQSLPKLDGTAQHLSLRSRFKVEKFIKTPKMEQSSLKEYANELSLSCDKLKIQNKFQQDMRFEEKKRYQQEIEDYKKIIVQLKQENKQIEELKCKIQELEIDNYKLQLKAQNCDFKYEEYEQKVLQKIQSMKIIYKQQSFSPKKKRLYSQSIKTPLNQTISQNKSQIYNNNYNQNANFFRSSNLGNENNNNNQNLNNQNNNNQINFTQRESRNQNFINNNSNSQKRQNVTEFDAEDEIKIKAVDSIQEIEEQQGENQNQNLNYDTHNKQNEKQQEKEYKNQNQNQKQILKKSGFVYQLQEEKIENLSPKIQKNNQNKQQNMVSVFQSIDDAEYKNKKNINQQQQASRQEYNKNKNINIRNSNFIEQQQQINDENQQQQIQGQYQRQNRHQEGQIKTFDQINKKFQNQDQNQDIQKTKTMVKNQNLSEKLEIQSEKLDQNSQKLNLTFLKRNYLYQQNSFQQSSSTNCSQSFNQLENLKTQNSEVYDEIEFNNIISQNSENYQNEDNNNKNNNINKINEENKYDNMYKGMQNSSLSLQNNLSDSMFQSEYRRNFQIPLTGLAFLGSSGFNQMKKFGFGY